MVNCSQHFPIYTVVICRDSFLITFEWVQAHFLWIKHTGAVTGEELVQSAMAIAGEELFDSTHFVVGDWLEYENAYVSDNHVKTLVAMMKTICQICPNVRNATVIRPDHTGNALMAFYKMLAEDLPWEIEIFHTMDEAYDWLGVNHIQRQTAQRS